MDLVDRLATTAFLGKEFLTWLWFKTDLQEGLITIPDGGPAAEIWFCDRIVLSGAGQGAEKVAVKTEDPSTCPECRSALAQGKKVETARIRIVRAQREWTVTIKGEDLAVGSVKLPAVLTKEEDDKARERFTLLDQLDGMIVALFTEFVNVRCDAEAWKPQLDMMRAWIGGEDLSTFEGAATTDSDSDSDNGAEVTGVVIPMAQ